MSRPPPPPPALPAARWRRGAERAGSGSSSARPQDGGRGRRARCWRRCWQAGGWPGGFLWHSAYRAPSAAALRDWSREVLREEAGGSFQSQPVLPTALIPHDALRDRRPERCLGSRECSAVLKVLLAEARRPLLVIRACPESRPAWPSTGTNNLRQPGLLTPEPPCVSDSIHEPALHRGTGKIIFYVSHFVLSWTGSSAS